MKAKKRIKMQAVVVLVITGIMLIMVMMVPFATQKKKDSNFTTSRKTYTPYQTVTVTSSDKNEYITSVQFYINGYAVPESNHQTGTSCEECKKNNFSTHSCNFVAPACIQFGANAD